MVHTDDHVQEQSALSWALLAGLELCLTKPLDPKIQISAIAHASCQYNMINNVKKYILFSTTSMPRYHSNNRTLV
jgi:hypothetical protein